MVLSSRAKVLVTILGFLTVSSYSLFYTQSPLYSTKAVVEEKFTDRTDLKSAFVGGLGYFKTDEEIFTTPRPITATDAIIVPLATTSILNFIKALEHSSHIHPSEITGSLNEENEKGITLNVDNKQHITPLFDGRNSSIPTVVANKDNVSRSLGNVSRSVNNGNQISDDPYLLKRRPTPLQHIAFIKTHKCASSTVQNILMRYGLENKLSFVLPKGSGNHIGWPYPFNPAKHMRPTPTNKADILCYHSTFSPKISEVMPADTFYLTAVRDPFTQLRSLYIYMNWYHCSKLNLSAVIQSFPVRQWICGAPAYNPIMLDLGFPVKKMHNSPVAIDRYIEMLDKRFNLVMIVEYFDESLIILRDMLGWKNEDILSFAVNFRQEKSDSKEFAKAMMGIDMTDNIETRALFYQKVQADAKLYLHFKKKLENIVNANKSYIMREKKKLEEIRLIWMEFCVEASVPKGRITDPRFRTYGFNAYGYILTKQGLQNRTCIDLAMAELPFVRRINQYQTNGLKAH